MLAYNDWQYFLNPFNYFIMYTKAKKSRNIKFSGTLLKSGSLQLKFQFFEDGVEKVYGYKLVEEEAKLDSNMELIKTKIKNYCNGEDLYHPHLYSLENNRRFDETLLIYKVK